MKHYLARNILTMPIEKIWQLPDGEITLEFDDGVITTTVRETILSQYAWWPQRGWPETPLLIEHHLNGARYKGGTFSRLCEATMWAAIDTLKRPHTFAEHLSKRYMEERDRFLNDMTANLDSYVTSISALDFLDVIDHPEIKAINDELQALDVDNPTVLATVEPRIMGAYDRIGKVLVNDPLLSGNRLAETVKSDPGKTKQTLQCISARGRTTDINDAIFNRPVLRGYAHGLGGLVEMALESRPGAKSLFLTKDPLQRSEYFNREMQLVAAPVNVLDYEHDCGSKDWVSWAVTKKNLSDILGLSYWEDDGSLVTITKRSTDLIGRHIKLRTPLTCLHKHSNTICGACYGELRFAIPSGTNIGHIAVTELGGKTSQDVMSTKHYDSNAIIEMLKVHPNDAKYISVINGTLALRLNDYIKGRKAKMVVSKDSIQGIADLDLEDVSKLVPTKVTSMTMVQLQYLDDDGDEEITPVFLGAGQRAASFTREMLAYLKRKGYTLREDRSMVIDLSDWDVNKPVWIFPRQNSNTMDFLRDVKSIFKSSGRNKRVGPSSQLADLGLVLNDFYDYVKKKFSISVVHLTISLRTTMVVDRANNDMRLPAHNQPREFATYTDIIQGRSLSAVAPYQEQAAVFYDPRSYVIKDRTPHPFDVVLHPEIE